MVTDSDRVKQIYVDKLTEINKWIIPKPQFFSGRPHRSDMVTITMHTKINHHTGYIMKCKVDM